MATFAQGVNNYKTQGTKPASTTSSEKTFLKTDEIKKRTYKPESEEEEFRAIQISSTNTDGFEEAFFHTIDVNGYSQKIYCPKHNDGGKCPLCDKEEALLATQSKDKADAEKNKAIWQESTKYKARKFYIIRGVDEGKPKDGVKFWRFGDSLKKEGVWDKLTPVVGEFIKENNGVEPHDPKNGCSFNMTCVKKTFGSAEYYEPSFIKTSETSAIRNSQEKIDTLINDPVTWKDIFRPSTLPGYNVEQYLQAVVENNVPKWDKNEKKWVKPDGTVISYQGTNQPSEATDHTNASLDANTSTVNGSSIEALTDDLPF